MEFKGAWLLKIDDIHEPPVEVLKSSLDEVEEAFRESLEVDDILIPIMVLEDVKSGRRYLADGRHRLEAAKRRGDQAIWALVFRGSIDEVPKLNAIANCLRGRPKPSAKARMAKYMVEELGMEEKDVARVLGLSRPYVSQLVRIAGHPEAMRALDEGASVAEAYRIAVGHSGSDYQVEKKSLSVKPSGDRQADDRGLTPITLEEAMKSLSLKDAMDTGRRFDPELLAEAASRRRPRYEICATCGSSCRRTEAKRLVLCPSCYEALAAKIGEVRELLGLPHEGSPREGVGEGGENGG